MMLPEIQSVAGAIVETKFSQAGVGEVLDVPKVAVFQPFEYGMQSVLWRGGLAACATIYQTTRFWDY